MKGLYQIKQNEDTIKSEQTWLSFNPVIKKGSIVLGLKDESPLIVKIGDGETRYADLPNLNYQPKLNEVHFDKDSGFLIDIE